MFSYEEVHGGDDYVPYISLDPLNDPQSFTFRIKVFKNLVLRNQILNLKSYKANMRLGLFLTLLFNVQLCQPHDVNDPTFDSKVRELGTPAMALYEPEVATKKATFGMS